MLDLNKIGLRKVVNASGRMSVLGVSTLDDSVVEAMKRGGQSYVEMSDLVKKSGEIVAKQLGAESAIVVNSASAGIALSIAGMITKDNTYAVEKLHQVAHELPNEVVILKGHNVDYGAPIETVVNLGGGRLKEVGYANGCTIAQLQSAITDQTVAVLFVQSHHCVQKHMPSLEEVREVCTKLQVPLIVDAAAEENLAKYATIADLAIFSGSKALEGPTSGIVAGKENYIQYVSAHLKGIGRAMKVGKESILGLLQALENFQAKESTRDVQLEQLQKLNVLSVRDGVSVSVHQDEAGREIYRGRITVDENKVKKTALEVVEELEKGEIAIYTRDYYANVGHFDIDPRPLQTGDMELIVEKLQCILGG